MIRNNQTSYGSVAKFFHWLIFLLVVVMILVGYFMGDVSDKALRGEIVNIHKITGITILALMILRALWALTNPKPALPEGTPEWQKLAERYGHLLLYVLLIAMPMFGWVGSVAAGYVPHIGGWQLNLPIEKSKALDDFCFSMHNTIAILIIVFVSLHIVAALYHHVIKKDNILLRMMPGKN